MRRDRVAEHHRAGSDRNVRTENIRRPDLYPDPPGLGALAPGGFGERADAFIRHRQYYLNISGSERTATDACGDYLTLLEQMLADYEKAPPIAPAGL
jgi:hypothetical protein